MLAAIAGDGASRRRIGVALCVLAAFVLPLPHWGQLLAREHANPLMAQLLENAYVLTYGALIAFIPITRAAAVAEPLVAATASP